MQPVELQPLDGNDEKKGFGKALKVSQRVELFA
jgi:hypothetical protein